MIELYWCCLIGGVIFAILSLLGGLHHFDGLHAIHGSHGHPIGHGAGIDWINPLTVIGGITAFGGAGILFTVYSDLHPVVAAVLSALSAIVLSGVLHFVVVRPMNRAETSIGYSIADYVGQSGQVTVAIPATGYGEVMVRMGAANSCQIAASHDDTPIPSGSRIVVVDVEGHTLFVAPIEDEEAQFRRLSKSDA